MYFIDLVSHMTRLNIEREKTNEYVKKYLKRKEQVNRLFQKALLYHIWVFRDIVRTYLNLLHAYVSQLTAGWRISTHCRLHHNDLSNRFQIRQPQIQAYTQVKKQKNKQQHVH